MNECSAHSAVKEPLVWEEENADFGNFDRLAVSIAGSGSQSCMRTETGLFVGKDSFVAVVAVADPAVVFVAADSVLVFVAAARLFDSMDGETGSVVGALAAVVEPAEVHPVAVAYTDLAEELPTAVALWKQRLAPWWARTSAEPAHLLHFLEHISVPMWSGLGKKVVDFGNFVGALGEKSSE